MQGPQLAYKPFKASSTTLFTALPNNQQVSAISMQYLQNLTDSESAQLHKLDTCQVPTQLTKGVLPEASHPRASTSALSILDGRSAVQCSNAQANLEGNDRNNSKFKRMLTSFSNLTVK